jgi:hypothetical protein
MKKLILVFAIIICKISLGLNYIVTYASFDTLTEVCPGAVLYMNVKTTGSYVPSDHLTIYIYQSIYESGSGPRLNQVVLFDTTYWNYFPNLPQNSDGSRTLNFNLPNSYPPGRFFINISYTTALQRGKMCSMVSLPLEYNIYKADEVILKYDINGKPTENNTGLLIIQYKSGKRRKVFIEPEY